MPEITVGLLFGFGFVLFCGAPFLVFLAIALIGLGIFIVESPKAAATVFSSLFVATIAIVLLVRWINAPPKPPKPPPPTADAVFIQDIDKCEANCSNWADKVACNANCIEGAQVRLNARAGVP